MATMPRKVSDEFLLVCNKCDYVAPESESYKMLDGVCDKCLKRTADYYLLKQKVEKCQKNAYQVLRSKPFHFALGQLIPYYSVGQFIYEQAVSQIGKKN